MNWKLPISSRTRGTSKRVASRGAESGRPSVLMIAVVVVGLALLGPGVAEAASSSAPVPSGSWPYPNG
ncbi:MAG: hypothetical protein WB867_05505, partial [Candidatus Dormiibacterota bacterium]